MHIYAIFIIILPLLAATVSLEGLPTELLNYITEYSLEHVEPTKPDELSVSPNHIKRKEWIHAANLLHLSRTMYGGVTSTKEYIHAKVHYDTFRYLTGQSKNIEYIEKNAKKILKFNISDYIKAMRDGWDEGNEEVEKQWKAYTKYCPKRIWHVLSLFERAEHFVFPSYCDDKDTIQIFDFSGNKFLTTLDMDQQGNPERMRELRLSPAIKCLVSRDLSFLLSAESLPSYTFLEELRVTGGSLLIKGKGSFSLSALTSLKILDLTDNNFMFEALKTGEFGLPNSLQDLSFSWTKGWITDQMLYDLHLESLPNLRSLQITNTNLLGYLRHLELLQNLESLSLGKSRNGGVTAGAFNVQDLPRLREISLHSSYLIPQVFFRRFESVTHLTISTEDQTGEVSHLRLWITFSCLKMFRH
jgi:hypothetical protein